MADIDGISSLALRAREGDARAGDDLMRHYRPEVMRIARHYDLPGGAREDLVQEGMIGIWRALPTFRPEQGSFQALALVAARRAIRKAVRRALRQRRRESRTISLDALAPSRSGERLLDGSPSNDPSPDALLFAAEETGGLLERIQRLVTPQQFEVVALRAEGLHCPEIARRLEVPLDAVEARWWRAQNRIRKAREQGALTLD